MENDNNIEEKIIKTQTRKVISTKDKVLVGLITSVLCVLGPFSFVLPFSPVPISFTSLAVYLGVYVAGKRLGCISCLVYLLIGFAGLPVFSGFTSGVGKLLGPTGGYLLGYVAMAYLCGLFIENWKKNKYLHLLGMVMGTVVCYCVGTLWLSCVANMNIKVALFVGVVPFVVGDIMKICLALWLGPKIRKNIGHNDEKWYN